ncbi:MAG: GGDEF domain-containing protein, partial [Reinekea sp.]|nr:GGDEF domain-containing protein [Reinekea sp.]
MQAGTTQIHRRRLIQLTGLAEVPLLFIGFKSLIEKSYLDASVLLISAVAMLSVFWALHKGKQSLASFNFVLILTLMVLFLQWNFGGIIDVSMLALPGILIFAAMIGALRIYNGLLLIMVANVLLMGYMSDQGFMFLMPSNGISSAMNVAVILLVVGFATRILSRDNFSLLKQLRLQIEEAETARNVVEHQAYHDYLTDLPNRMMAEKTFLEIQQRLKRHPEMTGGVIYIDFDEFKDINDNLGHAVGDQFLIRKTKRLKECTRVTDTLCRIGGDEFLVLVEDANEVQLAQFAGKLLDEVMAVENFDGHSLHCTCSIGIVFLPKDAHTYEQAVQMAD